MEARHRFRPQFLATRQPVVALVDHAPHGGDELIAVRLRGVERVANRSPVDGEGIARWIGHDMAPRAVLAHLLARASHVAEYHRYARVERLHRGERPAL